MRKEILDEGYLVEDLNTPHISGARLCKAIAPRDKKAAFGRFYPGRPRIVKSDFQTPPNWVEVKSYADGEPILEAEYKAGQAIRAPVTGGLKGRQVLVHTCSRPYDACGDNGFWGRWIDIDLD